VYISFCGKKLFGFIQIGAVFSDNPFAIASRPDIILATGRSDFPNQVNNVLGFPFIFRGALDVRATKINEEMKLAAVHALAQLAKEPVPEIVNMAYNEKSIQFGRNYIIPKPLDPRLITTVSPAVAKAAMESGVAKKQITDWEAYKSELLTRLGKESNFIRVIGSKARKNPKRVVFAEADNYKILRAAQIVKDEGIAHPILLGDKVKIEQIIQERKKRKEMHMPKFFINVDKEKEPPCMRQRNSCAIEIILRP